MSAALLDLLSRLHEGEGPDRDLDIMIALTADGFVTHGTHGKITYARRQADGNLLVPGQAPDMLVPRYTSSADAALRFAASRGIPWGTALNTAIKAGDDLEGLPRRLVAAIVELMTAAR